MLPFARGLLRDVIYARTESVFSAKISPSASGILGVACLFPRFDS